MLIHELPSHATRFIGRESELREILSLINDPACRLLTLIGQGGIGKTRLSIEVAQQILEEANNKFSDGIYFVPLAPITSANQIALAIANALNIHFNDSSALDKQLINHLQDRKLLLVMDNFEHVMEGVRFLSDLLDVAEQLTILVTSRERLHLPTEQVYIVQGMMIADSMQVDRVEDYDALLLFEQIAEKVDWRFSITEEHKPFIVRICQLVEGMPLAIELAAAWVRALSCETILEELERSFEFLGDSLPHVPERHRNLRIVFEYSWNMLTDNERHIFQSLSVFRGGFRREAVEYVTGATISSLLSVVDKSLIQHDANDRYQIHELLRQFAEEKLSQNPQDTQTIADRHCSYYADFLEQFANDFIVYDYDLPAIEKIKSDLDNVYVMWDWAITQQRSDAIDRACDSLYHYYRMWDAWGEARAVFQKALSMVEAQEQSPDQQRLLAKLLGMQSLFTYFSGLRELTDSLAHQGLELARTYDLLIEEARCLTVLGINNFEKGNYTDALQFLEDSLKIYSGFEETYEMQFAQLRLGYVYHRFNKFDLARQSYRAVIKTGKQRHVDGQIGWAIAYLGGLETHLGNYEDGRQHCTQALEIFEHFRLPIGIFASSSILAEAYSGLGLFDQARFYFHKALVTHFKHGAQSNSLIMINLIRIAHLLAYEGDIIRSFELASFVLNNSGAWSGAKLLARKLADELESELPEVVIESAKAEAENLELKAVMQDFIEEFGTDTTDESTQRGEISEQELDLLQQVTDSLASGSLLDENLTEKEQETVNTLMAAVDDILEREKSKMMASFMESASHDLRTPLSIINTSLYLLGMISDPDKQKGKLQTVKEQVAHLQGLIENLLDMARLDSGHDIEEQPVDLRQVMIAIRETHIGKLCTNRELDLQFLVADEPMMILADRENLEQALLNIIENAVHYTPDGEKITVSTQVEAGSVIVDVSDTGIGIAEDDQAHIFERFFRVDKARTERGRAGLGLAISKKIIEAHRGRIDLSSRLGEGSHFRVVLPQAR